MADISQDQKPLGSGFRAKSEPHEIMASVDLAGRTAVVTGGCRLGMTTARRKRATVWGRTASSTAPSRR